MATEHSSPQLPFPSDLYPCPHLPSQRAKLCFLGKRMDAMTTLLQHALGCGGNSVTSAYARMWQWRGPRLLMDAAAT